MKNYLETITWRHVWLNQRGTGTYWLLLGHDANRWHATHEELQVIAIVRMKDGSQHRVKASLLHLDGHGSDILGNDLSGPERALVLPEDLPKIFIQEIELIAQ